MTGAGHPEVSKDLLLLRSEIDAFNALYGAILDERRFDEWPELFLEDGSYIVQGRENFDRGLPLALISLESRGMMKDRVYGITQTIYHGPYYTRHVIGPVQVLKAEGKRIEAQANYAVFRTRPGDASEVYNVGRYVDVFARDNGSLRLASRRCIYDSEMVLNSLIYPV